MAIEHDVKLSNNARSLRKSTTKEERHLWCDFLKCLPVMVHRQKVIGSYIVDFYIAERKIVIELDGSQHFEEKGKATDTVRDAYLNSLGISVLRYSNADIHCNFQGVCQDILNHLNDSADPKASPWGEAVSEADCEKTKLRRRGKSFPTSVTANAVPPSPQGEGLIPYIQPKTA